jgi:glycogen(starch) synthase
VGGVASAVLDGTSGLLADREDTAGLAAAIRSLLEDRDAASRMAAAGREHARASFGVERLVDDLDGLYRRLLAAHR